MGSASNVGCLACAECLGRHGEGVQECAGVGAYDVGYGRLWLLCCGGGAIPSKYNVQCRSCMLV